MSGKKLSRPLLWRKSSQRGQEDVLKKLRKKFILTNMALVTLILTVVFAALVGYNYQRMVQQSADSMRMALEWSEKSPPPRFQFSSVSPMPEEKREGRGYTMVPVFVVTLDEAGKATEVTGGGNVEVSDEVVEKAVAEATEDQGSISSLDLRYLKGTDRNGSLRIAFADKSWERSSLWTLILTVLPVGVLALAGFFAISLVLSGLALKPVEEAWLQQKRFVADASHELKTPITVILTNTGILLSHREDTVARQQKWVEYIRDEAGRMRDLVEDLLFLARGDSGKGPRRDPAPIDFSELVWSALLPFEPVAFEAGVELGSQVPPGLKVSGRSDQLRRLVTILLDNAAKYAGVKGKVDVALKKPEKGGILLTVRNTGPAIPPEHLPHLFERFYRADDSRARTSGGYGLGLSIAKTIVDNHGGTISVSSREGEGTTFSVRLPE